MDHAFNFSSNQKVENKVIVIFHSFKNFAKLFRIFEICFGAFILLWSSTKLPFVIKLSGEYFRQLITILLSPLFIFVISNFIVLTLFLKSGKLSSDASSFRNITDDNEFYGVYSDNLDGKFTSTVTEQEGEGIVFEDKQTVFEVKVPRRTKSEKFEKGSAKEIHGKLRRSETEMCRKSENTGEFPVDELSNEEFQKTIEDFIAKQIKFHQEEKLAIVLHSQVAIN